MEAMSTGFQSAVLGGSAPSSRKTAEKRPRGERPPQGQIGVAWFIAASAPQHGRICHNAIASIPTTAARHGLGTDSARIRQAQAVAALRPMT